MARRAALVALVVAAACGGGEKKQRTTPDKAQSGSETNAAGDAQGLPAGVSADATARGPGSTQPAQPAQPTQPTGADSLPGEPPSPPVSLPDYDPDPAQAHAQVEQHLQIARAALASPTPDGDTALREARMALQIDAASIDAAAMVAFAYYHKRLYDTAELVLDDLFKRDAAKQNANVYYVYGLVYDHTSRPDQAVVSYRKAVEINPSHASALVNLGVHQLQNTQYAEALQTFDRLVNQFGRADAVTLTSLGSAYRGHAADYPASSPDHDDNVRKAEAAYKRALHASPSYGPAYYNLGLLYLDNDPFPGLPDNLLRLNTARSYFEQYKNMTGVDIKLYDDRTKDVTKAIKRVEKQQKKSRGGASPADPANPANPAAAPAAPPARAKRPGKQR